MQLTLSTAAFLERASDRGARRLDPQRRPGALRESSFTPTTAGAELRATDMEVGLRLPLDANVERPARSCCRHAFCSTWCARCRGADVSVALRAAEQDVEIISAGATFHLRTLRNEDFPHLPAAGGAASITLDAAPFIDTVVRVSRSASRDETRPVLTGILVWAARPRAAHGRHRLLPPERQDDAA